jgi:8-oxo-dGTP pyrophosphatase MutT (NUDIX family)
MQVFENKLENIKKSINVGLPGENAHSVFSPPGRITYKQALQLDMPPQKAAVLIPLFLNGIGEPTILLTLRKTYAGVHSGQISFPGGKFEKNENSPITVALREAEEEVGIASKHVSILGELSPLYIPPSHIVVFPVLAHLHTIEAWKIQEREVEKSIELSIKDFLNPQNKCLSEIYVGSQKREVPSFKINDIIVWGATAMILSEFLFLWNEQDN